MICASWTPLQAQRARSLTEEVMNEWREIVPDLISKIEDEDLRVAFHKAAERIWKTYEKQGEGFPQYYVIRMKK